MMTYKRNQKQSNDLNTTSESESVKFGKTSLPNDDGDSEKARTKKIKKLKEKLLVASKTTDST